MSDSTNEVNEVLETGTEVQVADDVPKPFTPDAFKSLANYDGIGGRDGRGFNNRQHWFHTSNVADWREFRNGRQIDAYELSLLLGADGAPVNCSRCGVLFQPYWVKVLSGDLQDRELLAYAGDTPFTEDDLDAICAHRGEVFDGAITEMGSAVALLWDGDVLDEGLFCGTPWFYDRNRRRTFPNTRVGCLGIIRSEWGDYHAQLQTAGQMEWMAGRFKGVLSPDQLTAWKKALDEVQSWSPPEEQEEGGPPSEGDSQPLKHWKDVTRFAVKAIQGGRGALKEELDRKLVDLFDSLQRPSIQPCLSRKQVAILMANKARDSAAGRAASRRLSQHARVAEGRRIRERAAGSRRYDSAPEFCNRLNIPPKTQ